MHLGDARELDKILPGLIGRADLVVTSPPYGCEVGNPVKANWGRGGDLCPSKARNYSGDKANLGHARGKRYATAMAEVYRGCRELLRPGGRLAVVTKNTRRKQGALDLASLTVSLAQQAGFSYVSHIIALHAAVRDGGLVSRPSFWQLTQVRRARQRGEPVHLVAHEDVSVFVRRAGQ